MYCNFCQLLKLYSFQIILAKIARDSNFHIFKLVYYKYLQIEKKKNFKNSEVILPGLYSQLYLNIINFSNLKALTF